MDGAVQELDGSEWLAEKVKCIKGCKPFKGCTRLSTLTTEACQSKDYSFHEF